MKRVGMLFAVAVALAASLCVADEPAEKKIYPVPPDKMAEFINKTMNKLIAAYEREIGAQLR